jgi:DNA modification methylase
MYEPFSSSGTAIIAAEQLGRRCYAMEIAPEYVDVSVLRWQQFTGKQATLDGDGGTFDAIRQQRLLAKAA